MSPIIQQPGSDPRPASQPNQTEIGAGNGSGNDGASEVKQPGIPSGFAVTPFDSSSILDEEFQKALGEIPKKEKQRPTIDEYRAAEINEAFERSARLNKFRWLVIMVQLAVALLQLYHQLGDGWTLADLGHMIWSAIVVLTMLLL